MKGVPVVGSRAELRSFLQLDRRIDVDRVPRQDVERQEDTVLAAATAAALSDWGDWPNRGLPACDVAIGCRSTTVSHLGCIAHWTGRALKWDPATEQFLDAMAILPHQTPCFRCFLGELPAPGSTPTCDTVGVLGTAAAVIAALEVTEALLRDVFRVSARVLREDGRVPDQRLQDQAGVGLGEAALAGGLGHLLAGGALQVGAYRIPLRLQRPLGRRVERSARSS